MPTQRPLDEATARAAAKAAFDAVKAEDVRVVLRATDRGFLRFAVNEVTTAGTVSDVRAEVTCAVAGNKHATVAVHSASPREIAEAARRAVALAELAPPDPELVPDPGPATVATVEAAWNDDLAGKVGAEARAALAATALATARKRKLVAAGFIDQHTGSVAVATRRGFFGLHHDTLLSFTTTARTADGTGSGWAGADGTRAADVDAAKIIAVACDKAERSKKPRLLDPGVYAVVLEPAATVDFIEFLTRSLDARETDEGRSPYSKGPGQTRIGDKLFGSLTLRTDPAAPTLPAAPFDSRGVVRTPTTWIENGVLQRLVAGPYWAQKKLGRAPDARLDVAIASGSPSRDDLVAGLERGLLVTRVWYTRMLEPRRLTITGLTRDGVFLVEKGKIVAPVNNFRFNQSVIDLFADTDVYGPSVRADGETDEPGALRVPALICRKFHMASRSEAV